MKSTEYICEAFRECKQECSLKLPHQRGMTCDFRCSCGERNGEGARCVPVTYVTKVKCTTIGILSGCGDCEHSREHDRRPTDNFHTCNGDGTCGPCEPVPLTPPDAPRTKAPKMPEPLPLRKIIIKARREERE